MNLNGLKRFGQKQKDTVFGYIRRIEKELFSSDFGAIPNGIVLICILFYGHIPDEFDPKHIGPGLILHEQTISSRGYGGGSAFLKRTLESGHHEWRFRIDKRKIDIQSIVFGIWRIQKDEDPPIHTWFTNGGNKGYCFNAVYSQIGDIKSGFTIGTKYGVRCNEGDVIEMILDFDDLSLSFRINGTDYGKAFDIKQNKYRAAVFLKQMGDTVRLLQE